jgi:putative phosphoserine phosphatase/1-acylglycerol-3-phosphate O-acyltransferase
MTGATVVPVGMWGTERVWPRSSRFPNMLNVTNPPLVTVRVGEPVNLVGKTLDTDTTRIMSAIAELLPPEAREPRTPTAEELALTYPHGKVPSAEDLAAEHERRPGSD